MSELCYYKHKICADYGKLSARKLLKNDIENGARIYFISSLNSGMFLYINSGIPTVDCVMCPGYLLVPPWEDLRVLSECNESFR